MRKIFFAGMVALCMAQVPTQAQVGISVNIGGPPAWAPYDCGDARFYFIPDLDVYYDVWYDNYWYIDCGRWVCNRGIPRRFARFDFFNCYKVVLDYRGNQPYRYYNNHRVAYASYRNWAGPRQYTVRDYGLTARPGTTRPDYYRDRGNYRYDRYDRDDRHDHGDRDDRRERYDRPDRRYDSSRDDDRGSVRPDRNDYRKPANSDSYRGSQYERSKPARPSQPQQRGGYDPQKPRGGGNHAGHHGRPR
ncbi:MAG TPA: hypothetical protein VFV37_02040 [Luteibaculaceae bacterium]|nr:hypothetical protein [Luteibaculaceae bacterium]